MLIDTHYLIWVIHRACTRHLNFDCILTQTQHAIFVTIYLSVFEYARSVGKFQSWKKQRPPLALPYLPHMENIARSPMPTAVITSFKNSVQKQKWQKWHVPSQFCSYASSWIKSLNICVLNWQRGLCHSIFYLEIGSGLIWVQFATRWGQNCGCRLPIIIICEKLQFFQWAALLYTLQHTVRLEYQSRNYRGTHEVYFFTEELVQKKMSLLAIFFRKYVNFSSIKPN